MLADKEALVLSLAGDITWQNAAHLRERLSVLVQKGYRALVLNLGGVSYADSSGLAVFIAISRKLRALGGTLLLVNASEPVMRALHQTRLCDYIPVVAGDARHHAAPIVPVGEIPRSVRTVAVPCDASCMAQTRRSVAQMLASLNLSRETTYDLVLALGEALGNAFDHGGGSQGEDGSVTVSVSVYRDRIVMEVNDRGCGCSYRVGDALPAPTETRGRGIRLMLMLADAIEIEPRRAGAGTCVRLMKRIDSVQPQSQPQALVENA